MLRYSREGKRWGPGTKAGAPVGVVYCLRTSSFFMVMPAPEFRRRSARPCPEILSYTRHGNRPDLPSRPSGRALLPPCLRPDRARYELGLLGIDRRARLGDAFTDTVHDD